MSAVLPSLIVALTVVAAVSAVILVRAAFVKPRIGALTERAILAVVIAVFGAVYATVAINVQLGALFLTTDEGRTLAGIGVVALLAIPAWWTALYLTGRLD